MAISFLRSLVITVVLFTTQVFAQSIYQFIGPSSGWGVVKSPTSYYTRAGGKVDEAEIGDLFVYSSVVNVKEIGSAFAGQVFRDGREIGKYVFACEPCFAYGGEFGVLTEAQQADISAYFQLLKSQNVIIERLKAAHIKKSPGGDRLTKLKAAYNKTYEFSKRYTTAFKKAKTPATRMRASDKLRELKHAQGSLTLKINQLEAGLKGWRVKNPFNESSAMKSNAYVALEKQRIALKKRLPIVVD